MLMDSGCTVYAHVRSKGQQSSLPRAQNEALAQSYALKPDEEGPRERIRQSVKNMLHENMALSSRSPRRHVKKLHTVRLWSRGSLVSQSASV